MSNVSSAIERPMTIPARSEELLDAMCHGPDDQSDSSCSPDAPVREIVTELARPALLIWDNIRGDGAQTATYVDLVALSPAC